MVGATGSVARLHVTLDDMERQIPAVIGNEVYAIIIGRKGKRFAFIDVYTRASFAS